MRKFFIFLSIFFIFNFTFSKNITVSGKLNLGEINLGGVKIDFISSDNKTTPVETDRLGQFSINLSREKYRIKLHSEIYYLEKDMDLLYDFSGLENNFTLNLKAVEFPSFIEGIVTNKEGVPISDTKLIIKSGLLENNLTTTKDGTFKSVVNPGTFTIFAENSKYLPKIIVKDIKSSSSITNMQIVLEKEFHTFKGVVTNGIIALKDVEVSILSKSGTFNQSVTTSENGYFEFINIPKDEPFTIYTSTLEYRNYTKEETISTSETNYIIILNK